MARSEPKADAPPTSIGAAFGRLVADLPAFLRYVIRRFVEDRGLQTAASLTYTTLLGLVPLFAVFLAMLSAFPVFAEFRQEVLAAILAPLELGPSISVQEHLSEFLENTRRLGAVGAIGIAVTAILMLNTIETTLNQIWRVTERRTLRQRIYIFWALLTLPPILIAASISLSGYFYAMADRIDFLGVGGALRQSAPFLLQTAAFTVLFLATPARRVRLKHAAAGGLVAAILFEGLKNLFGVYVAASTSQAAIYGALAAVPFFLVWLYMSWTMILIGAEVAAALPEWRGALAAERRRRLTSGERLTAAVGILTLMWRQGEAGEPVYRDDIHNALPADSADLSGVLARLLELGLVVIAEDGRVVLGRDLDEVTVYDLQRDLGLSLLESPEFRSSLNAHAPALSVPDLADMMSSAEAAKSDIMSRSIKSLAASGADNIVRPADWRPAES